MKATLLAFGTAAVLSVALTWPIAARLGSAGRLDSGDGRFSIWNVAWVAHALTTNPAELYQANIFQPHPNTLAYSEANLFAGVLAMPVWLATGNPYAASNWTILCAFALAFVTMFSLVRRLTGSLAGGIAAACWFAFCPFAFSHIPHVQLLMTFGLPLILIRLHAFVEAPTLARAAWLGAAMALQALACGYYGIMGGLIAGLGVLWFSRFDDRWRDWRYWTLALSAAALAFLIIIPFFIPYSEVRAAGFERTLEDARLHSVRWRSYLASPRVFDQWLLPIIGTWREVLFPGLLPILFTALAMVRWMRRRSAPILAGRGVRGYYLALAVLGFWMSLGPNGGLYTIFHEAVPFFTLLRAPARFGLLVTLALAVIGATGVVWIERRLQGRAKAVVLTALFAVIVARSSVGGLSLVDAPPVSRAYQRLAHLPRAAVAAFPYWAGAAERHRHTEYMVMSTSHWQPLINGYSDHIPAEALADEAELATFPSAGAWQVLRDHQARYVLVHWHLYPPGEQELVARQVHGLRNYLRPMVAAPDVSLYEIVSWPDAVRFVAASKE